MEDAETGEQLYVDTHDKGVPAAVPRRPPTGARRRFATRSSEPGVDAVSLSTDEDLVRRSSGWRRSASGGGGSAMSFIWPAMLLLARGDPAGRRWLYLVHRAAPAAAGRDATACSASTGGRRRRRGRRLRRRLAGGLHARRADRSSSSRWRGRRASSSVPRARGHGHPRLRRVGQHGRHRPRADPDGGRQGRRPGVRRATSRRRSGSASSRSATAGFSVQVPTNDQAHGRSPRSTGSTPAARDVARPAGSLDSLTTIAAAEADPTAGYYTNRSPDPTPEPTRSRRAPYARP